MSAVAHISGHRYDGAQHSPAHAYLLPVVKQELAPIKTAHAGPEAPRLFDLGCGNGSFGSRLADGTADAFGLPLARIAWQVTEADIAKFREIGALAVERWNTGPLAKHARLVPRSEAGVAATLEAGGGIYHPAGTTRIGPTAETGVVDAGLNVHGVPGLRALATSVFPNVGGSSPSLALVQLSLRLAGDIAAETEPASARQDRGPNDRRVLPSDPGTLP
ncbi:GMC family oxidoreductase [Roseovarius sp.]|uniref:GMC family oxidoreductase n=1 Tax=Roseovarius sp. TaxID=1486281 RepID=UPI00356ABBBF